MGRQKPQGALPVLVPPSLMLLPSGSFPLCAPTEGVLQTDVAAGSGVSIYSALDTGTFLLMPSHPKKATTVYPRSPSIDGV